MRILFIGLNFFPEIISTGKYSGELAVYLSSHGHDIPCGYCALRIIPNGKSIPVIRGGDIAGNNLKG